VSVGSGVELSDFSVSLAVNAVATPMRNKSQEPGTVAVLMPHGATEFTATGLRVTTAGNASNATAIDSLNPLV
jgi:hypothetical protein